MNNIKSERHRLSLTQEMLADELGVSDETVRRWEKEHSSIPSSKAVEMAKRFGCTIDYLFGVTDERTSTRSNA